MRKPGREPVQKSNKEASEKFHDPNKGRERQLVGETVGGGDKKMI